ncbi:hypothetical protein F511_36867 [Dorcoceras hygrometricum]|uniref:Uncharacterized protein n=1 Tax=Dorcoceras hygrometricum TaxID=472368 RepID=A0A2Z7ABC8_9LAMI|nr:hypothetical protein F511_36867 [Dorcoceras hygrometricum]
METSKAEPANRNQAKAKLDQHDVKIRESEEKSIQMLTRGAEPNLTSADQQHQLLRDLVRCFIQLRFVDQLLVARLRVPLRRRLVKLVRRRLALALFERSAVGSISVG